MKAVTTSHQESEQKLRMLTTEVDKQKNMLKQSHAAYDPVQKQCAALQKDNQELKGKLSKMLEFQKGFASVLS